MKETPSDVVELIIAVDLNPSDPEEPINISSADVKPKGGENEGETKLIDELLEAVAKLDPDYAMAIGEAGKDNPRAAVRALQRLADKAPEAAQDEVDRFDKAMDRKPEKKAERPERPDFKRPEREDDEEDDFEPKKKSGGFGGARDKAFGKEPKKDFDKGEDDFGDKKPFEKKKKFDDEDEEW